MRSRPGAGAAHEWSFCRQLCHKLEAMVLPFPHRIEGFTGDIPYFMRIADFFVGKPGPGSISEALCRRATGGRRAQRKDNGA